MLKPIPKAKTLNIETDHEDLAKQLHEAHNNGEVITIKGVEFRSESFSVDYSPYGSKVRIHLTEVRDL